MNFIKKEEGLAIKALVVLILILGIGIISVAYTFGKVVYPGYMGVRQITIGPSQGYSKDGLVPGYHWDMPFYSKIHILPTTVQEMHLHRNAKK